MAEVYGGSMEGHQLRMLAAALCSQQPPPPLLTSLSMVVQAWRLALVSCGGCGLRVCGAAAADSGAGRLGSWPAGETFSKVETFKVGDFIFPVLGLGRPHRAPLSRLAK